MLTIAAFCRSNISEVTSIAPEWATSFPQAVASYMQQSSEMCRVTGMWGSGEEFR